MKAILIMTAMTGLIFAGWAAGPLWQLKFDPNGPQISPVHYRELLRCQDLQMVAVPKLPGGNGYAAGFNGRTSGISLEVGKVAEAVRTDGGVTIHIRARFADSSGERYLAGRYMVAFLTAVDGWPHGKVSLQKQHYGGSSAEAECEPGRFYDIFLLFAPKSSDTPKVETVVFDSQTGQLVNRSAPWPSQYAALHRIGEDFTIGRQGGKLPFQGEISTVGYWDRALADAEMRQLVGFGNRRNSSIEPRAGLRHPEAIGRWRKWLNSWSRSFPVMAWGYFQRYQGSVQEYQVYRDAGLTMVMAPPKTAANAAAAGLRVFLGLWGDDNRYVKLQENPEKMQQYLKLARQLPHFGGWMFADEPPTIDAQRSFGPVHQAVYQHDPTGLPLVDLLSYPYCMGRGFELDLESFITANRPAALLTDCYTLYRNGATDQGRFYQNYEIVRRKSQQAEIGMMGFVLLTSHGPFRQCSESDLAWQVHSLLAYGAKGIVYYNYRINAKGFAPAMVSGDEGTPTELYFMVRKINEQLHRNAALWLKLDNVAVYHLDRPPRIRPPGTTPYYAGSVPGLEIRSGNGLLISEFRHRDRSERYVMLLNKRQGMGKPVNAPEVGTEVELALPPGTVRLQPETGEWEPAASGKRTLGGGEYLLLKMNDEIR